MVDIPEDNAEAPLSLAEKLWATTRQYISHVFGLVKSYWPHTSLDPLGEGMKSDCDEGQFEQYLLEVSPIADRIMSSLENADRKSVV